MIIILVILALFYVFFSSRRRHTRYWRDWSSDVCSSDLAPLPPGDPRPDRGRRAVRRQVGVPGPDRERPDRLLPRRPLHRRRADRGEEAGRLVRDALHPAGDAQPARPGLVGRLPGAEPVLAERRSAGAADPPRLDAYRPVPGPGRMAGRLLAAADAAGARHRVRPSGAARVRAGPAAQLAAPAPLGRVIHQLV